MQENVFPKGAAVGIMIYFLNIKINLQSGGGDRSWQGGGSRGGKESKHQLTSIFPKSCLGFSSLPPPTNPSSKF